MPRDRTDDERAGAETDVDLAFQVGAHTRPGFGGVLEHVFNPATMAEVTLGGRPVGEVELNAMGMSHFGVPTGLVTGDDQLERQIAEALPRTKYVVTKESRSMRAAVCRPPERVRADIEAAAAEAVAEADDGYPFELDVEGETEATVQYNTAETAEKAALWPHVERVDSRTISYRSADRLELYRFVRAASKV